MTLQQNFSLKAYNTFGVDITTKYFAEVSSLNELIDILKEYKNLKSQNPNFQLMFLGGGSNILFTKNFEGLVIKLNLKGISEEKLNENEVLVTAKAGENWHNFVMYCVNKNYGGLENLSLIPGNVGTSPMQNIGAYGVEIKDCMENCKALNIETLEVKNFSNKDCEFAYRESIFKQNLKNKYIIIEVTFKLTTKNHQIKVEYGAIQEQLNTFNISEANIKNVSDAVIAIRESKLPNPKILGNAGSFFKNPTITKAQFEVLQTKFPNIHFYPTNETVKIPAGWLIEQSGWKGKQIGNVATHHLQSLVIINKTGNATGKEIYDFSAEIINSVKEKFGIELEREVNIV